MDQKTSIKEQLEPVLAPFRGRKGVLVPALQAVQEKLGYLPKDAMDAIGEAAGVSGNVVYGVATFYAQFRTTPLGKNRIMVCRGTACHVRGGPRVLDAIERSLCIKEGETTPDMKYTLETVACIGACALAPTMMINKDTYRKMTIDQVTQLFGPQKKGA